MDQINTQSAARFVDASANVVPIGCQNRTVSTLSMCCHNMEEAGDAHNNKSMEEEANLVRRMATS